MKQLLFASVVLVPVLSAGGMAQEGGDRMSEIGAAALSQFTETETQKIKDFFNKRSSDLARGQKSVGDEDDDEDEEEFREEERQDDKKANKNKKADKGSKGKGKSADRGRGRGRGAKSAQGGRPSLPPGIAKNLERGKAMPPGIARNYLPSGLDDELPVREGQSRVVIDDDVVLVDNETDVIIDVIEDVLGRVGN